MANGWLRTSDPTLSAEDLAAAYKQLLTVERGWRDMKGHLGLRSSTRREDRIRAHVHLCWLALLLIRVTPRTPPVDPSEANIQAVAGLR